MSIKRVRKKNFCSQIMRSNFNHPIIKRLRKSENDFYRFLRLHRAEFGHSINKKKTETDYYGYYPDVTKLINKLSIHLKVQEKNLILEEKVLTNVQENPLSFQHYIYF